MTERIAVYIIIDMSACPRCGESHRLSVRKLNNPMSFSEDRSWAWWAMCPTKEQPILISLVGLHD